MDLTIYRDWLFRGLDADEIEKFIMWAQENYKPGSTIKPYWHPVVRRECERINEQRNQGTRDGKNP